MNRRHLMPHVDELRRYALVTARAELARLLDLFPELRAEVIDAQPVDSRRDKHHAAVKSRALKHWRKTAAPAASSNGHATLSLTGALRQSLTSQPQRIADLTAKVEALGYKHVSPAGTPLGNRVAQTLASLRVAGETRKTKRGWMLKGDAAK